MPNYVRRRGEGGTFALTVCLVDRRQTTLTDHADTLRAAFCHGLHERPVRTDALCISPDHLRVLWTLPPGDTDDSVRVRLIKTAFTRLHGHAVFQDRFYEHTIHDADDHANHVNSIHANPANHGHVADWRHSTWHRRKRENTWSPPPEGMHMA